MNDLSLSSEERELFSLIMEAAAINQFNPHRFEIDKRITAGIDYANRDDLLDGVVLRLKKCVQIMDEENRLDVNRYNKHDQKKLRLGASFLMFHLFIDHFDEHIQEQLQSGDKPIRVTFYDEVCQFFQKWGIHEEEYIPIFALCFQVRRAFYFIQRRLIGTSKSMENLRRNLWNNIFTYDQLFYKNNLTDRMEDFSTLILGETGSGKGTAAAAIGYSSYIPFDVKKCCFKESFTKSFTSVNLSQYSESLIESELFGHRKGAFTGAVESHKGLLAQCSAHGSVFLDEIGDVSIPVQIKLLHVIQERNFTPVGSHEPSRFSGRIIGATNRNISQLRKEGAFRDDFYYRLCSDVIKVPTLYERIQEDREELTLLVNNVVMRIVGVKNEELAHKVVKAIIKDLGYDYQWHGNVRELEQCVRRIILQGVYHGEERRENISEMIDAGQVSAQSLLSQYCGFLYSKYGSYEAVGRITKLDRRTVKKYVELYCSVL